MRLDPPVSLGLHRHGDSQFVVQCMMLAIAVMFWLAAKAMAGPVMAADTYGVWVTSWPAEVWAGSIMAAAFAFLMGIMINGEWRWSPALRLLGAAWHVVTLTAFCVGAAGAAHGNPVVIMCMGALGVHLWFVWLNAADLRRAVGGAA